MPRSGSDMQTATRSLCRRTCSSVASADPPSTMMTSAGKSCRRTDSRAASMTVAELKHGMMIEKRTCADMWVYWDESAPGASSQNVPALLHVHVDQPRALTQVGSDYTVDPSRVLRGQRPGAGEPGVPSRRGPGGFFCLRPRLNPIGCQRSLSCPGA